MFSGVSEAKEKRSSFFGNKGLQAIMYVLFYQTISDKGILSYIAIFFTTCE